MTSEFKINIDEDIDKCNSHIIRENLINDLHVLYKYLQENNIEINNLTPNIFNVINIKHKDFHFYNQKLIVYPPVIFEEIKFLTKLKINKYFISHFFIIGRLFDRKIIYFSDYLTNVNILSKISKYVSWINKRYIVTQNLYNYEVISNLIKSKFITDLKNIADYEQNVIFVEENPKFRKEFKLLDKDKFNNVGVSVYDQLCYYLFINFKNNENPNETSEYKDLQRQINSYIKYNQDIKNLDNSKYEDKIINIFERITKLEKQQEELKNKKSQLNNFNLALEKYKKLCSHVNIYYTFNKTLTDETKYLLKYLAVFKNIGINLNDYQQITSNAPTYLEWQSHMQKCLEKYVIPDIAIIISQYV